MILIVLLLVLIIVGIICFGAYIANNLFDNEEYLLMIVAIIFTIVLSLESIYLVVQVVREQNISNSETIKIVIYASNGDVLDQYDGNISNISYTDNYIKFVFEEKEYLYQNSIVKIIKED